MFPTPTNPPNPPPAGEDTPPTQQEIQELAQGSLATLTEESATELRAMFMRNMSEAQRQHYAATNQDPLVRFVYQKAEHELINRRAERQARNVQIQQWQQRQRQQQQQQQAPINSLPPLALAPQRGINAFTLPHLATNTAATAPTPYNHLLAEAAMNLAQAALVAPVHLPPDDKCANCGGVAKQSHTGHVHGRGDDEALPLNYCSRNCQRGHWASIERVGGHNPKRRELQT